jgi:hypothetical protein
MPSQFWTEGDPEDDEVVNEVASMLDEPAGSDEESLEADVERRIEVVTLYKLLLSGSMFKGVDTPASRIVTARLRKFATDEVKKLLGMMQQQPKVAETAVFDADEIQALKSLAAKVLRRAPPPAQLATVDTQPMQPQLATVSLPPAPQLAMREVAQQPQKPKPVAQTQAKPQPPQAGRRIRKAEAPPEKKVTEVTTADTPREHKIFRVDETKNGRVSQSYVDYQNRPALPPGSAARDATPQVRPPDAMPMPNPHQMGMIMEQQAVTTVNSGLTSSVDGGATAQDANRLGPSLVQLALKQ